MPLADPGPARTLDCRLGVVEAAAHRFQRRRACAARGWTAQRAGSARRPRGAGSTHPGPGKRSGSPSPPRTPWPPVAHGPARSCAAPLGPHPSPRSVAARVWTAGPDGPAAVVASPPSHGRRSDPPTDYASERLRIPPPAPPPTRRTDSTTPRRSDHLLQAGHRDQHVPAVPAHPATPTPHAGEQPRLHFDQHPVSHQALELGTHRLREVRLRAQPQRAAYVPRPQRLRSRSEHHRDPLIHRHIP